jgi:hypothetical protein
MLAEHDMRTVTVAPRASVLIESMREIGYSLASALADIIDNAITAGATTIHLLVDTGSPEVRIGVIDDGHGMTESELIEAMRPGSRSPLEDREPSDLGRFGLGLKTASFSQCRRLTVVTRCNGATHIACWDLDYVAEKDDWLVQIPDDPASVPWAGRVPESGTLVLWEKLDRVIQRNGSDADMSHFIREIDDSRSHLELVFHRFLSPQVGQRRLRILLNERPLEPFDPFHSKHPATITGPVERIRVGQREVVIQPFTLPHHKKVSPAEWERYAGPEGYLKNQGFYVYRERRLIIYGTWFGLARQTELTKLARVRIDMPNDLDAEWKIDVKKASAQPPYQVRQRLRRIIETIVAPAKRIYTRRGRKLVEDNRIPVWSRIQDKGEIIYRINQEHPVLANIITRLPSELRRDFLHVLEMTAAALPMDALFADMGGEPDRVGGNVASDDTLRYAAFTTYRALLKSGILAEDVMAMMRVAEPFRSNWSRTEEILNEALIGEPSDV